MKALTVQQPWAWAIVHGGKDVENRTQAWSYRGPLAIHAGARWSERGLASPLIQQAAKDVDPEKPVVLPWLDKIWKHEASLPLGAIIGVVDLVDVHSADWCWEPEGLCSPWAEPSGDRDVVHLVLESPRPLRRPIAARGRLGLWTPPADVLELLGAAL